MAAKRAYIVAGPESSGNRMLAALLVRAGCIGSGSMNQPSELPLHEDPVVVVRSYPHGNDWPDLRGIYATLRDRGYMVRVVVPVRDAWCVIQSQAKRQHHPPALAFANIRRAYTEIFGQLAQINAWWIMVPFESLVLHPSDAVWRLLEMLDLPVDNLGSPIVVEGVARKRIEDTNAKHYSD